MPQIDVEVELVPEHRRLQELARDGVSPQAQAFYIPLEPDLREGHRSARWSASKAEAAPGAVRSASTNSIRKRRASSASSRR